MIAVHVTNSIWNEERGQQQEQPLGWICAEGTHVWTVEQSPDTQELLHSVFDIPVVAYNEDPVQPLSPDDGEKWVRYLPAAYRIGQPYCRIEQDPGRIPAARPAPR